MIRTSPDRSGPHVHNSQPPASSKKADTVQDKIFAKFLKNKAESRGSCEGQGVRRYENASNNSCLSQLWHKIKSAFRFSRPQPLAVPQGQPVSNQQAGLGDRGRAVRACYKSFTASKNPETYSALKKAYENAIALAGGNPERQDAVNAILRQLVGASVSEELLQYETRGMTGTNRLQAIAAHLEQSKSAGWETGGIALAAQKTGRASSLALLAELQEIQALAKIWGEGDVQQKLSPKQQALISQLGGIGKALKLASDQS